MPTYCYKCPKCNRPFEIIRSMSDPEEVNMCGYCDVELKRNFMGERVHADMGYQTPQVSTSLGILPEQADEHRRRFPDVTVLPDGQVEFPNAKVHDAYMKKRKVHKDPQHKTFLNKSK